MKHLFDSLKDEYQHNLASMRIVKTQSIDEISKRLLVNIDEGRYKTVSEKTGIPQIWIAASFEREASSNFSRSPAQGDRWDHVSVHVPRGRGPFMDWNEAAEDAYHLNGLDLVGVANWSWALACYYGELFNGFGYRDYHSMRSPYLWGGTNLQQPGKYVEDGKFDPNVMDSQIGIVPIMMRLAQARPELKINGAWPFLETEEPLVAPIVQTPLANYDIHAIQQALLAHGYSPGPIDGSFGRKTSNALRDFEAANGLKADGLLDYETIQLLGI